MGGCWCCWFHHPSKAEKLAAGGDDWRGYKERLVREGRAHAALVFDGHSAIGWCEYGRPTELPGIFHRKQADFTYPKAIGKNNCVMRKVVEAASYGPVYEYRG